MFYHERVKVFMLLYLRPFKIIASRWSYEKLRGDYSCLGSNSELQIDNIGAFHLSRGIFYSVSVFVLISLLKN